jgi:hypothetical protein
MDFLQEAERYVRLGFKVFPLKPLSKVPLTEHGVLDATDDMDVLARYVRNHPNANIAVGCGPESGQVGLTVIDVDKHHGGISFTQKGLTSDGTGNQPAHRRSFTRKVKADVYGNTLQVRETWSFPAELPDTLSFHIAEADSPLEITWQCSSPHHTCTIDVAGMQSWRSPWGPIQRLHQLDITPADEIHLAYTLTPLGPRA